MSAFQREIRSYRDLIEAISALKNERGLSHETVEDICGLTRGHWHKVFGPSAEKRMGWMMFDLIPAALGFKIRFEIDEPRVQLMKARWEGRNKSQIRVRSPEINKMLLDLAKTEVFREMARQREAMRTVRMRSENARNAARARWRKRRSKRNGSTGKSIRTRQSRSSNPNLS